MFNETKAQNLKETLIICGYQTEFANAFTNAVKGNLNLKDAGVIISFSQDKEVVEDLKGLLSSYLSSSEEANQVVNLAISNAFSIVKEHP